MRPSKKTLLLWGLVALLGLLQLLPPAGTGQGDVLPVLPALARDEVRRIEITAGQVKKVVISGDVEGGFFVTQPYQGAADWQTLKGLLKLFEEPIPMDLRVDQGNLDEYGVDDNGGVLVELFDEGDGEAEISMVVGYDVAGGSSYLRLRDSDAVYRAKVGGRGRYEREPMAWKDRSLVTWDHETITDVEVLTPDQELHFQRRTTGTFDADDKAEMGPWLELEHPDFDLDQLSVTALARSLAILRAGRTLSTDFDGGFDQPDAIVTLRDLEGRSLTLTFGSRRVENQAFARVSERDEAFVVAGTMAERAARPLSAYRDLQVFAIPRGGVARMTLEDSAGRRVLRQLDDGMWEVLEPANVDADVKQILFTANTLSDLRAHTIEEISLEQAGLDAPASRITMLLQDGSSRELLIGAAWRDELGRPLHYVKRADEDTVYGLRDVSLSHIRRGFGRGE